ncbi:hypothetical protein L6452_42705 [Arctium lappa]|uniref:Uncharacterized protein n=1 Tax=Arctium lappa TaxID=4217 RepID=A0ACB8XN42_ARCLA|nr:hypothetical protein L6452_42705 [Arctium lappa]
MHLGLYSRLDITQKVRDRRRASNVDRREAEVEPPTKVEQQRVNCERRLAVRGNFPSLFCYSIKDNIEPKFNYLEVEMGRELRELVEFQQYFSFSLE